MSCHAAAPSCEVLACLQVLDALKTKGISIRVASPKLVMEEAPESYKVGTSLPLATSAALLVGFLPLGQPMVEVCRSHRNVGISLQQPSRLALPGSALGNNST